MTDSATVDAAGPSGATFEAILEAGTIQSAVTFVHALVDECHLRVDETGLRLSAIDPATVACVDLTVDAATFESLEGTATHVGLDLERFRDVVRMADRGQSVRLRLDAETRTLEITIDDLEYTLALLDPETVRTPFDSSNRPPFTGAVVTDAGSFSQAVRAADMVSTHLALGIDEEAETFYVEAEGDTDSVSVARSASELVDFSAGEAHSLFSLEYLVAIDRALSGDCELDIRLGTEQPLALESEFADGAGAVEYLVAPRITAN